MGKHKISRHLKTVMSLFMFSLKWRNVLFAKDDGKGNFLAVTCRKSESIHVSRRKEVLFTEGLVQVSNCILGVWNLLTQPKRLHKLVKRFLAIISSFIIHSLKTRLAASLGLWIALLTCLLLIVVSWDKYRLKMRWGLPYVSSVRSMQEVYVVVNFLFSFHFLLFHLYN